MTSVGMFEERIRELEEKNRLLKQLCFNITMAGREFAAGVVRHTISDEQARLIFEKFEELKEQLNNGNYSQG
jgi:hypothetical protein